MFRIITIKVKWDEASIDNEDDLDVMLEDTVDLAVQDGMLSPTGEEIVDRWTLTIRGVDD